MTVPAFQQRGKGDVSLTFHSTICYRLDIAVIRARALEEKKRKKHICY